MAKPSRPTGQSERRPARRSRRRTAPGWRPARASTRLRIGMTSKNRARPCCVAEVVEQQVEAGLAQRRLDGVDHLGEEPAVDERHDHADGRGAPAGQPGGERRGDVVEFGGGVQHPVAGARRRRRAARAAPATRSRSRRRPAGRRPRCLLPPFGSPPSADDRKRYRPSLADSPACAPCTATVGSTAAAVRDETAMLVDGGVISWIGRDDGPAPSAGTRVVDLAGALVTPAFVDAHVHATGDRAGADRARPARGARSLARGARRWSSGPRAPSRGRPVLGGGWDETGWPERRPPTAAELDRAGYGGAGLPGPRRRALGGRVLGAAGRRARAAPSSPASGRTGG